MLRYTLPLLCVLAACASPQERCLRESTKELRVIDGLIAEQQLIVSRGYTVVRTPEVRSGLTVCVGDQSRNVGVRFCNSTRVAPRERAVAVDLDVESRKLAQLRARRDALITATSQAQKSCLALPAR